VADETRADSPAVCPGTEPENGGGHNVGDIESNEHEQNEHDISQHWGTSMRQKHSDDTRLLGSNINTFPKTTYLFNDKVKFKLLQNLLQQSQADIFCTQEDNLYLPNVESYLRPDYRCRQFFDNLRISPAYNTNEDEANGVHLQGGVSIWAIDELVGHSREKEVDSSGLGRWVYQRIAGKDDRKTRIYSAYRPCLNKGEQSVYSQHIRGLSKVNDARCPLTAFMEDLAREINVAREAGEMIILQADMNMDTTSARFTEWMTSMGLRNPLLETHGHSGPATYLRGSKQIDCILISPEIEVTGCGYLPDVCAVGDHLPIWIDFRSTDIFGPDYRRSIRPNIYRLQADNPIAVRKYIKSLKRLIHNDRIHTLVNNQYDIAMANPDGICGLSLNQIFSKITEHMEKATEGCRRIFAGDQAWSPMLKRAQAAREFWRLVIQLKKGKRVCKRTLRNKRRLSPKQFKCNYQLIDLKTAHEYFDRADTNLRKVYKEDEEHRLAYQTRVCAAAAIKRNTSIQGQVRQRVNRECQRRINRAISSATPSKQSSAMRDAVIPDDWDDDESPCTTYSDKNDVEEWALRHIHRNFKQIYDTPSFQHPFISDFGLIGISLHTDEVMNGTYEPPAEMDKYLRHLILRLKRPQGLEPMDSHISPIELREMLKILKAKTSAFRSGPVGLSIGYRVLPC